MPILERAIFLGVETNFELVQYQCAVLLVRSNRVAYMLDNNTTTDPKPESRLVDPRAAAPVIY